ncbi:hypothetical protein [Brevibacterium moorei]|uniref:hypothetical protein n=1 Tax=Brevibacterium moorei TaxID=2968457 RepID=UPI00211BED69|nr:hypothetical protein [Brevibacterium sp. 68QC2CO]MCQ9385097.1 hypothetical protein [Brevibacterium sp. 68QC2CO]
MKGTLRIKDLNEDGVEHESFGPVYGDKALIFEPILEDIEDEATREMIAEYGGFMVETNEVVIDKR